MSYFGTSYESRVWVEIRYIAKEAINDILRVLRDIEQRHLHRKWAEMGLLG